MVKPVRRASKGWFEGSEGTARAGAGKCREEVGPPKKAADMVIRRATLHIGGGDNLRWGQYVRRAAAEPAPAVGTVAARATTGTAAETAKPVAGNETVASKG